MCPVIKDLFFNNRNCFSGLIEAHTRKQEHMENSATWNTSEKGNFIKANQDF